jgi:hypothetical protein
MNGVCPSFSQGVHRHSLQPADIPSEQILIFVKDQYQQGRVGSLIESLFYSKDLPFHPPEPLKPLPTEDDSLTREEIWRRFGLVLVRRTHGKFVTWEQISNE